MQPESAPLNLTTAFYEDYASQKEPWEYTKFSNGNLNLCIFILPACRCLLCFLSFSLLFSSHSPTTRCRLETRSTTSPSCYWRDRRAAIGRAPLPGTTRRDLTTSLSWEWWRSFSLATWWSLWKVRCTCACGGGGGVSKGENYTQPHFLNP